MNYLENLKTFIVIAETGSFTQAAEQLYIAKSAASRRLSELETHLGVQLFRRTTRSLHLTDEGQKFYESGRQIINDLHEAEQAIKNARLELQGKFRLAAPLTFGLEHLTPALNDFMSLHPKIEFDIDFSDREVDVINEGFDLVLRIGDLEDSSLMSRTLCPVRRMMAASPDYLEQYGIPTKIEHLKSHMLLRYSRISIGKTLSCTDKTGKKHSSRMPVALTSNNGTHLMDAAIAGKGIVVLPTFITHRAIQAGKLIPLLTDYSWSGVQLHALYPHTRHLSQRVRTFIDFLGQRFAPEPYWDQSQ